MLSTFKHYHEVQHETYHYMLDDKAPHGMTNPHNGPLTNPSHS